LVAVGQLTALLATDAQRTPEGPLACRAILADRRHEVWTAMLATLDEKERRKNNDPPHRCRPARTRGIHAPDLHIDTNGMKTRDLL
jgi:hypothetical protein